MIRVLGSGSAALRVSAQGFGCMGMTAFYGHPIPDADAVSLMTHAFAHGITHWDTAEVYQGTDSAGQTVYNETVVGMGIAAVGQRDALQIATKYMPRLHAPADAMTPDMCIEACRASCARLGVTHVDLYYVHRMHPTVSVEEQARGGCSFNDSSNCVKCIILTTGRLCSLHLLACCWLARAMRCALRR